MLANVTIPLYLHSVSCKVIFSTGNDLHTSIDYKSVDKASIFL